MVPVDIGSFVDSPGLIQLPQDMINSDIKKFTVLTRPEAIPDQDPARSGRRQPPSVSGRGTVAIQSLNLAASRESSNSHGLDSKIGSSISKLTRLLAKTPAFTVKVSDSGDSTKLNPAASISQSDCTCSRFRRMTRGLLSFSRES